MDAYTSFAQVYDLFMDNVPYQVWGEYLDKLFKEYGIEDGLLLKLLYLNRNEERGIRYD